MDARAPVAISYRPKEPNYLPVVVAAIRRHLDDWPIVLVTQHGTLPPSEWLRINQVQPVCDWTHSPRANKVLRFWEHQQVLSERFERWIWWHDDMLPLRHIPDPLAEFSRPLIAHGQKRRPNKELSNWHGWLWDTLNFFRCLNIYAPNPVLHTPRLVEREVLETIPKDWNRKRLLFEPTYLLWYWHTNGIHLERAEGYRKSVFAGSLPRLSGLAAEGYTILSWGRKVDHQSAVNAFTEHYPLGFGQAGDPQ